jgi:hypothetical protein
MKRYHYFFCIGILILSISMAVAEQRLWTWLYGKRFSDQECKDHRGKQELIITKQDIPAFSQLILSWNAFRVQGYYSFLVQARDARTKRWYPWHRMMEWGNTVQCSYISTTAAETNYYHVRLEIPKGTLADAFRIKVEVHEGADLLLLKGLFISVSDFGKFEPESHDTYNALKSFVIKGVPQQSQRILNHPRADHLCCPTSTSMLLGFLKGAYIDPVLFAEKSYDLGLDSFGSWPFAIAHAFEYSKGSITFCVARLNSFADLYHHMIQGIPVVVSVRGDLKGAIKSYPHGHLLVVIGWDAHTKKVICHDPAFVGDDQTLVAYDAAAFLAAWERSHRLAYLAEPITL